jgi:hypothetical protein
MATFDITLPINKTVVFPPRCVVCEAKNPDGLIKLSFLGIKTTPVMAMAVDYSLDMMADMKYYGMNSSNQIAGIPACKGCAAGLKWYHRLLKFAYYTAWIPGLVPLVVFRAPTIISVPFLILCALAPGIFTLMFPPSFGASFWDNKANFEFKSKTVAEEFLRLNSDATLKADAVKPAADSLTEVKK